MKTLSDLTVLSGMIDEFEKIGFDTAAAMEAIGIPAAVLMGYHHGGVGGAAKSGIGATAGLGAGMGVSHVVKKVTDASPWLRQHRLVKSMIDAAPTGILGAAGGAAGEHFTHKHAQVKLSGALSRYLWAKLNPILALDAINEVGKVPGRAERYVEQLKQDARGGTQ